MQSLLTANGSARLNAVPCGSAKRVRGCHVRTCKFRRLRSIAIGQALIQSNCSGNQENCRGEEQLADEVQNKRLRIPPQEDLGFVRRGRTCPEVQERQDDEQDATRHECSSAELVGPRHLTDDGSRTPPDDGGVAMKGADLLALTKSRIFSHAGSMSGASTSPHHSHQIFLGKATDCRRLIAHLLTMVPSARRTTRRHLAPRHRKPPERR